MIDGYYRCRNNGAKDWEYIGMVRTDEYGSQLLYLPGYDEGFALEDFTFHHIKIMLNIQG